MFSLSKKSFIFILAPSNSASGGQESLHQLGYALRMNNYNVKMAYYSLDSRSENPVPQKFEQYHVPFCHSNEIDDLEDNILICPEIVTWLLYDFKKIRKIIWWLSLDFYKSSFRSTTPVKIITNVLRGKISKIKNDFDFANRCFKFNDNSVSHLTTSKYAFDYVKSRGASPVMLRSTLGLDFQEKILSKLDPKNFTSNGRKNRVLYNPAKKNHITNILIKKYPEIEFLPLKNYSPDELIDIMQKSKVYIDFGKFPGPERLPKEAASCGCCIITGKRGASAYYEDVRIPERYKFSCKRSQIKAIVNRINDLFENYDAHIKDFYEYVYFTQNLQAEFEKGVLDIFQK